MVAKSRLVYILLAFFLGELGIHNFYAGHTQKAVIQLVITLLTGCFGIVITLPWAIIEIFTVTKDGRGVPFA